MNDVIRRINIDLYAPKIYEVIRAQQGDDNSRCVEFELYNQGNPYEITNDTIANVEGVRADSSGYIKSCEINNNIITFVLDDNLLYYDGAAKLKLVLYSDNKKVLSSIPFKVSIERNPLFNIKLKKDEYSLVNDVLNMVGEMDSEVNNNTNAIREINDNISHINDSLSVLGKCKNLLKTTLGSGNGNGITYINNGDGTYTLNGTCTNTLELHFNPALKLPYGKYKLLGTSAFQKTNNGEWIATLSSGDVFEVSESKPMLDVVAYISSGSVVNQTVKPMVTTNLNTTVDDFVPYTGDGDTLTEDVAKVKNELNSATTWEYITQSSTASEEDVVCKLDNTWKEVMVDIDDTSLNGYARGVYTIYRECITYNGNNYFRTGIGGVVVNITNDNSVLIPELNSGINVKIYFRK